MAAVAEWIDTQLDRTMARQRAQVDAAKLLATFLSGIAAGLVASALQINGSSPSKADESASAMLAASILVAIALVLADRLREVDHEAVLTQAVVQGYSSQGQLNYLRAHALAAVSINDQVVMNVRRLLGAHAMFACASIAFGLASMLGNK